MPTFDDVPSPSIRVFGAFVKELRREAGLTREQFGERVGLSPHTVSSYENGRRKPDPGFAERAGKVLGYTAALQAAFAHVDRERLPAGEARWRRVLDHSVRVCAYHNTLVPEILRTRDYARAVSEGVYPFLSTAEFDPAWDAHTRATETAFADPSRLFNFIVDEVALRRGIGGGRVTRDLINHLLTLTGNPSIGIQILPATCLTHPGLWGPISMAEVPDHSWQAHTESQGISAVLRDRAEVSRYKARYDYLSAVALSPSETVSALRALRTE